MEIINLGQYIDLIKQKNARAVKDYKEKDHLIKDVQEHYQEMINKYPILKDEEFLNKFPEADTVILPYYAETKGLSTKEIWKKFPIFKKIKIKDIGQYIEKLQQKNPAIIKDYESIKDLSKFL
jgi:hypothetical protein